MQAGSAYTLLLLPRRGAERTEGKSLVVESARDEARWVLREVAVALNVRARGK